MRGSKGHQKSRKQRKQTGFKELAHICVLCSAIASPSLLSSSPIRVNPSSATPGWGVCVLVCVLCFHPATPGWSVRFRCVLGVRFRLRPATPGWAVGVFVCLCARSARTLPLLAGLCGVGVCAWAGVSAAPRHSWLGCWIVCVLVCALGLVPCHSWLGRTLQVCVLELRFWLRSATPGWRVVVCVCVCVRVPPVPRHSWLVCATWVCALGLGFWLRPGTPG